MKRIITPLALTLAFMFCMTTMSYGGWFNVLPRKGFSSAIDNALKKERWNHPEEAKEKWRIALEKGQILLKNGDPKKTEYLIGTARAYYALGDYANAIELYEKMIAVKTDMGVKNINKDYPWVYVYLGLANAKLGNSAKAVGYWEQVPMAIGSVYRVIQDEIAQLQLAGVR